jgi:hypothetical protein
MSPGAWFGYKLHLVVDAKHEVALAYEVTTANAADAKSLPNLVRQAQANLPEGRIEALACDKAADDHASHRVLHQAGIRPGIQNRRLGKDQTEQMLPGRDGRTSVERVNGRLKIFWGVDDGSLVGARRFHVMVGTVRIVHVAFATLLAAAPRREGTLGKLRLGPIPKALSQQPAASRRPKCRRFQCRNADTLRPLDPARAAAARSSTA